jgi:NAD-dependent dihydropyrimidine dehydrogenase PreA subunit
MTESVQAVPDPMVFLPVLIDEELCIGCNLCLLVCQADLFLPNPVKGGPPFVFYGGECWYEGSCVDHCPVPAITLNLQLFNRALGGLNEPRPATDVPRVRPQAN